MSNIVKLCLMALNVNSSYLFGLGLFIIGIIIACVVWMATKFHIANMTLESKVNVKSIQIMSYGSEHKLLLCLR